MSTKLVGNPRTGNFVIQEGYRIIWAGRANQEMLSGAAGLRPGMWLQGGDTVSYDAGECPYTEARERFRRDYVRNRVPMDVAASFDPELLDDTRRRAAARLNERLLTPPDADFVRKLLLDFPVHKDADLTLDFEGPYGEIVDELRNKPRM